MCDGLRSLLADKEVRKSMARDIAEATGKKRQNVDRYLRLIRDGKRGIGKKWEKIFKTDRYKTYSAMLKIPQEGGRESMVYVGIEIFRDLPSAYKDLERRGDFGSWDEARRYIEDLVRAGYIYPVYIVVNCDGIQVWVEKTDKKE